MSYFESTDIYWIGPRESDIEAVRHLFRGSITIFGSNKDGNHSFCNEEQNKSRIDHNNTGKECDDFFIKQTRSILARNHDAKFIFYNPNVFYSISGFSEVRKEYPECFLCLNEERIMKRLNDKNVFRDDYIPRINDDDELYGNLAILKAQYNQCRYETIQRIFNKRDVRFIFQAPVASGGHGTFILTKDTEDFIRYHIRDDETYLVSEFQENNVSVNLHAVIFEKDIIITPGSVQIMHEDACRLLYRGADFISYRSLREDMRRTFEKKARELCTLFQKDGYRGVCGIDAIFSKGKVFLLEVNNRFQASTNLLNHALLENGYKSMPELQIDAFQKKFADARDHEIINIEVNFSNYSYINNDVEEHFKRLISVAEKNIQSKQEVFSINYDGFPKNESDSIDFLAYSYLYRVNFCTNITWINDDQLLNVSEHIIDPYFDWYTRVCNSCNSESAEDLLTLKISLMVQGVRFSDSAEQHIKELMGIRSATNNAVDIIITDVSMDDLRNGNYKNAQTRIVVNAPTNIKFNAFTPFVIDTKAIDDNCFFVLTYYGIDLMCIELFPEDELKSKKTSGNIEYSKIAFLSTDRLRLHLTNECKYKSAGLGCHFCNMEYNTTPFYLQDIEEVIKDYRKTKRNEFNHYLIGGQSLAEDSKDTDYVNNLLANVAKAIRRYDAQGRIYAMILPPVRDEGDSKIVDRKAIKQLRDAGVNEFAFNIEIFDEQCAKKYMPGKSEYTRNHYLDALRYAATLTKKADTRSLLVVGLEGEESLKNGIKTLAESGVQPILSVFRPLPHTLLKDALPPSMKKLFELYYYASEICKDKDLRLGPGCMSCQNNTLSMPY